jgi:hypothetical protein
MSVQESIYSSNCKHFDCHHLPPITTVCAQNRKVWSVRQFHRGVDARLLSSISWESGILNDQERAPGVHTRVASGLL